MNCCVCYGDIKLPYSLIKCGICSEGIFHYKCIQKYFKTTGKKTLKCFICRSNIDICNKNCHIIQNNNTVINNFNNLIQNNNNINVVTNYFQRNSENLIAYNELHTNMFTEFINLNMSNQQEHVPTEVVEREIHNDYLPGGRFYYNLNEGYDEYVETNRQNQENHVQLEVIPYDTPML